ncbi:MAG TPA: CopD family protein, partial [Candidatus Methylomirabilis sp.]|nr:CopD family protein [Candidatus Methylomirabilis sp.]
MIPLVLVWLRAAGLVGQALALGSGALAVFVLRPARERAPAGSFDRALALSALGALLAAAAEAGVLATLIAALADDTGRPTEAMLGSAVGVAAQVRIAAGVGAAVAAAVFRRRPDSRGAGVLLLAASAALCFTGALSSHAAGRIHGRAGLLLLSAVHQAAASLWVGGLATAALLGARAGRGTSPDWLRPFSALAFSAVAALALTGVGLSLVWIATPAAAIGTSYGAMVLTKAVLFIALLAMGGMNFRALRGPADAGASGPARSTVLARRLEVEAGLAVVTLFLAASIGSAPPASDVGDQRATLGEISRVIEPGWPRLQGPTLAELNAASAL